MRVAAAASHFVFLADVTAAKIDTEGGEYKIVDYIKLCPQLRLLVVELHVSRATWQDEAKTFESTVEALAAACRPHAHKRHVGPHTCKSQG